MILVVGSTGFLGGEICRRLAGQGKSVRALVRATSNPERVAALQAAGVETVIGDLREPATLQAACQGIATVISTASTTLSMQPGDSIPVTDQQGQLDLVKAAVEAGVKQFILVSIPYSVPQCPLRDAKRAVENTVISSGMTYIILRPGIFMEIWLSPAIGFDFPNAKATIYGDGHAGNPYISLGDVAEYAVQSVEKPGAQNKIFDLGGSQTLNLLEVVRIFEKTCGNEFELQFVPEAALQAQLAAASDPLQASFAAMMLSVAQGIQIDPRPAVELFNIPLVSVEDYARRVTA